MKIIEGNLKEIIIADNICIALGTFDGIHRGHQRIIMKAVQVARDRGFKSAVLTFDKHPSTILNKDNNVKLINDNDTKAKIIETLGVDYLFFINFNKEFADIKPEEFIRLIVSNLKVKSICCGYNYSFGKGGIGNTILLNHYKGKYNYDLNVIEKTTYKGLNISSSIIREKIVEGKISEANLLLGYNYFYTGIVTKGKELGNKLGFPTANLTIPDSLCLKNGVYISLTEINGKVYQSISNVGYAPTIEGVHLNRTIETHLIGYNGDLYGKEIRVNLIEFLRGEMKFNSVQELKNKVLNDINKANEFFSHNNIYNM